jgi:hypothetical protein
VRPNRLTVRWLRLAPWTTGARNNIDRTGYRSLLRARAAVLVSVHWAGGSPRTRGRSRRLAQSEALRFDES